MRTYRQTFLDVVATLAALLGCEARRDSHHHMTGSLSLICEDVEKRAPTGVVDAFGEVMIPHHPRDIQVLHTDAVVPRSILVGRLKVEVAALASDLQMLDRHVTIGLAAAVTAFFAATDGALRMGQAFLSSAVVARVLDDAALRVGQKDLQPHIQPNHWMLARCLSGMSFTTCVGGRRLADN